MDRPEVPPEKRPSVGSARRLCPGPWISGSWWVEHFLHAGPPFGTFVADHHHVAGPIWSRMASTAASWLSKMRPSGKGGMDSSTPAVLTMQPRSAILPYSTASRRSLRGRRWLCRGCSLRRGRRPAQGSGLWLKAMVVRDAAGAAMDRVLAVVAARALDVPVVQPGAQGGGARWECHGGSARRGPARPGCQSPPARCTSSMWYFWVAGATLDRQGTRRETRSMSRHVEVHAGFAGGGQQVQDGVGGAAHGHVQAHGVFKGFEGGDAARQHAGVVLFVVASSTIVRRRAEQLLRSAWVATRSRCPAGQAQASVRQFIELAVNMPSRSRKSGRPSVRRRPLLHR